ncbi:hypothetical protein L1987_85661 [Smallanthus sonchifolius]|uniref:Uncharacterized protein n=1 Tax=Smallanthus sonchifolius TaxID=185202 RepID=A0ACB8XXK5_9ASTR|nr:hypothetical protein L1987_85661 [Smallanthus sonchifolius]
MGERCHRALFTRRAFGSCGLCWPAAFVFGLVHITRKICGWMFMAGGGNDEKRWHDVPYRRKNKDRHGEQQIERNVTKFYITNLPNGCTPWEVIKVKELEQILNGIKMGKNKLRVNIAKFAVENARLLEEEVQPRSKQVKQQPVYYQKPIVNNTSQKVGVSFAEMVKGNPTSAAGSSAQGSDPAKKVIVVSDEINAFRFLHGKADFYFFKSQGNNIKPRKKPTILNPPRDKLRNNTSSPVEGIRPKKRCRSSLEDPFGLDSLLNQCKIRSASADSFKGGINSSISKEGINPEGIEITGSPIEKMLPESKLEGFKYFDKGISSQPERSTRGIDPEVSATIEIGSKLGVQLVDHLNLVKETIVLEGNNGITL